MCAFCQRKIPPNAMQQHAKKCSEVFGVASNALSFDAVAGGSQFRRHTLNSMEVVLNASKPGVRDTF